MTERTSTSALAVFVAGVAVTLGAACSSSPSQPAVAPEYQHIAEVHHAQCGKCHTRVEPGQRTRAQLEPALARHRTRVHLSEDEWNQMVDYLAAK